MMIQNQADTIHRLQRNFKANHRQLQEALRLKAPSNGQENGAQTSTMDTCDSNISIF